MHLVFQGGGGSVKSNSTLRLKALAKSNSHPRMLPASFPRPFTQPIGSW